MQLRRTAELRSTTEITEDTEDCGTFVLNPYYGRDPL
jgi:hypothetical protein